jgi:hypothetical protein
MYVSRGRARAADGLGLLLILLVLADYLRPSLLLLPTIAAGGDTPCHYPTAVFFRDQLLPHLRWHGWYAGAYLGHPLLLYYFPLPFLLMAALAPLTGMPVAFKLGTVIGVFLLPLLSYASFRLMGWRFPTPLLAATASLVFLLVEDNPIWGGTLASTLTGEFSYTYGIGLGTLFLGGVYHAYSRGKRPLWPGVLLAATVFAHGYAVLWAGLSASFFLYGTRRLGRTLVWLLSAAALGFALAGAWLLPLVANWGWTTPYDDPWITVTATNLFPPLLWPLFALALLGLAGTLLLGRRTGGADQRLLFLLHSAVVGAALAAAGPALGIIDVRFVPFAQLAAALAGAAVLGLLLQGFASADLAALAVLLLAIVSADSSSKVLRFWADWNYTGVELKENWPAFNEAMQKLHGSVSDPRVAVEYSQEHEKAGSIRVYETLPFFSGRSTLEGVYNQASLQTHEVYYLASELDALSPNPFRSREYSSFDTDNALRHLRLFNVSDVIALSAKLIGALERRSDVESLGRFPPYALFRLKDPGGGYVEPLAFAPVRSPLRGWREKAYRWFTRKPLSPVHLVFSDDPRFTSVEADEWLPPAAVPLAGGVSVEAQVGAEEVRIHTSRPGHPLLVKISYHPRWKAEGADGPFLVSPALMLVIPRQNDVRLYYSRGPADAWGWLLSLGGVVALGWFGLRPPRPAKSRPPLPVPIVIAIAEDQGKAKPRSGWLIPVAILLALASGRLAARPHDHSAEGRELQERASRAYAEGRYADAAEYARQAEGLLSEAPRRAEVLCLQAEGWLRAGRPRDAADCFDRLVRDFAESPYVAEALYGLGAARSAAGDTAGASEARARLLGEHADTPWAARARNDP